MADNLKDNKEPDKKDKEPEDEQNILEPPDPETKYFMKLKDTLNLLLKIDADNKANKNAEILDDRDVYLFNSLISQDKWEDNDLSNVFKILKHYKKNLTEDIWKGIVASNQEYIKYKKSEGIKGCSLPIKWVNDEPTEYAVWYKGNPYILTIEESTYDIKYRKSLIILKNHNSEPIQNVIKRLKIIDNDTNTDMIKFEEEIFEKSAFVNLMVYPSNVNNFTACLNALPVEEGEYREPKFYVEDGTTKFPDKCYARRDVDYQKVLISGLNVGDVNPELYAEGIALLKPKQLTLHYGIIGANIMNVLDYEDYLITIDAIGESDTGKSFTIDMTLAMDYGIFNSKMNDDALKTSFRHHAIANATNLPIYIEEALLDEKSMARLKSTGKNIRGNMDKSLTNYDVLATFIFSRNTESKDTKDIDAMEKKAQDKRIYKFTFDKEDVITDDKIKNKGKDFINKLKGSAGGMLYQKLKNKKVSDIIKKYKELKEMEKDGRKVVAMLGAWIMDDPDFKPVVSEIQTPTIIDEFFAKLLSLYHNKDDAMHNSDGYKSLPYEDKQMKNEFKVEQDKEQKKWKFQITVIGFNIIKKGLGINQSARSFAEGNGFEYKTTSIEGNKNKGIVGDLPKEYADMLNKTETENNNNAVNINDDYDGNPSIDDLGL